MESSAAAKFCEQVKALEAVVQSRLCEHVAQVRKELSEDIETFRQCALTNVACEARKKRQQCETLPLSPRAEMAQDCFAAALLEPARAVHVNGQVLHIHDAILRKIPYFAAFLEGQWQDQGMPQIDLPCSAEEFGLLVRRLYTAETLGSLKLPIESCASAIRIVAASGMLLIDQNLPELRDILIASVRSTEDMQLVDSARAFFPDSIANVFDEVDASILPDALVSMVDLSKSGHARVSADQILQAHRGRFDASMLTPCVSKLLASLKLDDHQWARKIMQNHMHCNDATLAIQQSAAQWSFYCRTERCVAHRKSLHAVVADHLARCAKTGSLKAAFQLGTNGENTKLQLARKHCLCGRNVSERPLGCFGEDTAEAIAHALLAEPHELKDLATMLATMSPSEISNIVTDEVLASLGGSAQPVLTSLANSPHYAISWCSVERLHMLPIFVRKSFCSKLLGALDKASPEVAKAIEQILC